MYYTHKYLQYSKKWLFFYSLWQIIHGFLWAHFIPTESIKKGQGRVYHPQQQLSGWYYGFRNSTVIWHISHITVFKKSSKMSHLNSNRPFSRAYSNIWACENKHNSLRSKSCKMGLPQWFSNRVHLCNVFEIAKWKSTIFWLAYLKHCFWNDSS